MAAEHWTDEENDRIVADYFVMLASEIAGNAYNKSEHRRQLGTRIERSEGAIEYKHQNISAVLMALGETWITGYRPAANFQDSLVDAVVRALHRESGLRLPPPPPVALPSILALEPPPALRNEPPPESLNRMLGIARQFDVAARDERNRALGRAGEERVLAHEKASLRQEGRPDLANRVRWVSEEDGDGAGYDIMSFSPSGESRLIEVKTTIGWEWTPFYISANELKVAEQNPHTWRLFRLWNFARKPRAFELFPPITDRVSLIATGYEARIHHPATSC